MWTDFLNDVKNFLKIDVLNTTFDDILNQGLNIAGSLIEGYTRRHWLSGTYTEKFYKEGWLKVLNFQSITSVKDSDGTVVDYTTNENEIDKTSMSVFVSTETPDILTITYTAGFDNSNLPYAIRQVLIELAAFWFYKSNHQFNMFALNSANLGEETYEFKTITEEEILKKIDNYIWAGNLW